MKGRVAAVSPYLLIVRDHRESIRGNGNTDIPFSDFKSTDATELFKLHNTVCEHKLSDAFHHFSDKIRRQRNKIMHSAVQYELIEPEELLVNVLHVHEELFPEKKWTSRLLDYYKEDEYSSLSYGRDLNHGNAMYEINIAVRHLKPKDTKKYFGFDPKSRAYICPVCYDAVDRKYQRDSIPKLAQLRPSGPGATSLYCFVCEKTSSVKRTSCKAIGCRCNVISAEPDTEGMCLTCCHDNTPAG